ncbi:hypothetical protein M404DRAFT_71680, partial [Pisolithus tinctorius Marx 270]
GLAFKVNALLDSGATGVFIDKDFIERNRIPKIVLPRAVDIFNVNGGSTMILGHTWLCQHNLLIDWRTSEVKMGRCPARCQQLAPKSLFIHKVERLEREAMDSYVNWICNLGTDKPKTDKTPEELVPKAYHECLLVFSEKESEHMLLRKPW